MFFSESLQFQLARKRLKSIKIFAASNETKMIIGRFWIEKKMIGKTLIIIKAIDQSRLNAISGTIWAWWSISIPWC